MSPGPRKTTPPRTEYLVKVAEIHYRHVKVREAEDGFGLHIQRSKDNPRLRWIWVA